MQAPQIDHWRQSFHYLPSLRKDCQIKHTAAIRCRFHSCNNTKNTEAVHWLSTQPLHQTLKTIFKISFVSIMAFCLTVSETNLCWHEYQNTGYQITYKKKSGLGIQTCCVKLFTHDQQYNFTALASLSVSMEVEWQSGESHFAMFNQISAKFNFELCLKSKC